MAPIDRQTGQPETTQIKPELYLEYESIFEKYFITFCEFEQNNKTLLADHHPPLRKNDIQPEEYRQEQGLDGSTCNNLIF